MSAYLIYRPVMDYEESEEAHFICSTQEKAEEAVQRIRDFCADLAAKINPLEVNERHAELANTKWLLNVDYSADFDNVYSDTNTVQFNPAYIAWRELPLDPES